MPRSALKYWAVLAMLIDHIAWKWVPDTLILGQLMHVAGRTTAPIMCFFVAEGYKHTRNFNRYLGRLLIFTAVSMLPYMMFHGMYGFFMGGFPVMWTLACGLLAIHAWEKIRSSGMKFLAIFGLCLLSIFGDWMFLGVLMCLSFWVFRKSRAKQSAALIIIACISLMFIASLSGGGPLLEILKNIWYQGALVLAIPFIWAYNGKKGKLDSKWFFFIFYPVHLLVINALKMWVFP